MKILFDQNISHRLISLLSDLFPEVSHVRDHGLQRADDETIWAFARDNNLVIVSKDSDFHERSFLYGFPPKVIWLRIGNCTTKDLEEMIRANREEIERFCRDDTASFLVLP